MHWYDSYFCSFCNIFLVFIEIRSSKHEICFCPSTNNTFCKLKWLKQDFPIKILSSFFVQRDVLSSFKIWIELALQTDGWTARQTDGEAVEVHQAAAHRLRTDYTSAWLCCSHSFPGCALSHDWFVHLTSRTVRVPGDGPCQMNKGSAPRCSTGNEATEATRKLEEMLLLKSHEFT